MKILIIAIGKIKEQGLSRLADDYAKRTNKYQQTKVLELKNINDISKHIKENDFIIACDEAGKQMASVEFAKLLETKLSTHKRIVFLVGGADGLNSIRKDSNLILSFSNFTFQHDIARVVLFEQIYRAMTIIKGEPYHR